MKVAVSATGPNIGGSSAEMNKHVQPPTAPRLRGIATEGILGNPSLARAACRRGAKP